MATDSNALSESALQGGALNIYVVEPGIRSRPRPAWVDELRWHKPTSGEDWLCLSGPPTISHAGQFGMCLVRIAETGGILKMTHKDASALARLAHGAPQSIETMPMWACGVVTDGEHAAVAQKAESDFGGHYFAVEAEDGLEWEPTNWTPLPTCPPPQRITPDD